MAADEETQPKRGLTNWGKARVGLAFVSAVGSAVLFLVLRLDGSAHVCHEALAQTGDAGVVRVCDAVGLIDFAPIGLVVVLLLLPNIAELNIVGLGSIKTRVAAAEAQQAELAAQVMDLRSSASAVAAPVTNVNLGSSDVAHAYTQLQTTLEAFGAPRSEVDGSLARSNEKSDAELKVELLDLWDKRLWPPYEVARRMRGPRWRGHISAYVQGALSPDDSSFSTLEALIPSTWTEREIGVVADWAGQFAEQIDIVRQGRNAVAHPRTASPLDQETLRRLVAMGEELADVLEGKVAEVGVSDVG